MTSVLITGTSSDVGRLTAGTLARQGHQVHAGMRAVDSRNATAAGEMRTAAEKDSLDLRVVPLDVSDPASIAQGRREGGRRRGTHGRAGQHRRNRLMGMARGLRPATGPADARVRLLGLGANRPRGAPPGAPTRRRPADPGSLRRRPLRHANRTVCSAAKHAAEALAAEGYRSEPTPLRIDSVIVEPGGLPTVGSPTELFAPGDAARVRGFGAVAECGQGKYAANGELTSGADAPDPQPVADATAALIAMPTGQRPLRSSVGPPPTPRAAPVNDLAAQVQEQTLPHIGLADMRSFDPARP